MRKIIKRLQKPRQALAAISISCIGMLAFGAYLQYVEGLEPCPMCIVQRYCLTLVCIAAGLGAFFAKPGAHKPALFVAGGFSVAGAFVAARQSWLQWYPPEFASCGRDFYGMIENYSLSRALPLIFRGSGDCSAIDWTFLGGSIANWSFIVFVGFTVLVVVNLVGMRRR